MASAGIYSTAQATALRRVRWTVMEALCKNTTDGVHLQQLLLNAKPVVWIQSPFSRSLTQAEPSDARTSRNIRRPLPLIPTTVGDSTPPARPCPPIDGAPVMGGHAGRPLPCTLELPYRLRCALGALHVASIGNAHVP